MPKAIFYLLKGDYRVQRAQTIKNVPAATPVSHGNQETYPATNACKAPCRLLPALLDLALSDRVK